ncbi:MAG TPA: glycosyltransferase family 4 protein [Chthoniobacterales bacterium]|nr:glycosyltransferase family 4 protein [Chthoniobacterales bacterium]
MENSSELIVMPSGKERGGAEEALLQYVSFRAGHGVRPHVMVLEPGSLGDALSARDAIVTTINAGRLREVTQWIAAVQKIAVVARREKPPIILSWMTKGHLYGGVAGMITGIRAAYYQHGLPDGGLTDRVSQILPAAGALACSNFVAREQQKRVRYPVKAAPAAVDISRFDPARHLSSGELKQRFGFDPDRPLIGIVGRLQRWKGMHVFAEAMKKVIDAKPQCQGVIVGGSHELEPEYSDWLKNRIDELGLSQKVVMVGRQQNVPDWMQAMDVIIHASDREPFGIVVLEAMSLGKPVVATKPGGPEEIIQDNENGLLVPANNAAVLADAIIRYLSDPGLAARFGAAARQRALMFTPDRFAQRVIEVLEGFSR